ncbi:MAG: hypothetical protein QOF58_1416 [Pseudonocardiales bacterium]|nr:hypothetical protein [Pseudonocardiales bacterium]
MSEYDYVVVGGGTAGCVLAARLSEDPSVRVLLLEAGEDESPGLDYTSLWGSGVDWAFRTTPQQGLDGVVVPVPQGKVLGGSGAISSMAHVRAHRSSYDAWERAGATGWNYETMLPFLKRSENAAGMDPRWRGVDGPMIVSPGPSAEPGTFYCASYQAAEESGAPVSPDGNGQFGEGVARTEMNVVNFARQSTADAYLTPARHRPNLSVLTGAHARQLIFDGRRCSGVEYLLDGQPRITFARQEIVLTAGVIGSAQLLMLSGIGRADELRKLGIDVVQDLPGVGENLQDHPVAHVTFTSFKDTDDGVPDTPHVVLRSDPAGDPDLQLVFAHFPLPHRKPGAYIEPWGSAEWRLVRSDGYSVLFSLQRPHSRGSVKLISADPGVPPLIDPGYYTDPRDLDLMVLALWRARAMGWATALSPWRSGELAPGNDITDIQQLREYVKLATSTLFHHVGTCAIGPVLDPELRVHGVEGLRVADASVMPTIVAANPNATVLAIAERAAAILTRPSRTLAGSES